jgi:hypothetical protein
VGAVKLVESLEQLLRTFPINIMTMSLTSSILIDHRQRYRIVRICLVCWLSPRVDSSQYLQHRASQCTSHIKPHLHLVSRLSRENIQSDRHADSTTVSEHRVVFARRIGVDGRQDNRS